MTAWPGSAERMAGARHQWSGTLMLIGQPAEEVGKGAQTMLDDGLFSRFPQSEYALSVHDAPSLPAGVFGFHPGSFRASLDEVTIVLHGRGGYGAKPYTTIDPVVMSARAILGLQTIVARETDPFSPLNDPATTKRLVEAIRRKRGPQSVVEMPQKMTSEDFSVFGRGGARRASPYRRIGRRTAPRAWRSIGPLFASLASKAAPHLGCHD